MGQVDIGIVEGLFCGYDYTTPLATASRLGKGIKVKEEGS
jgi:hypothetical protein